MIPGKNPGTSTNVITGILKASQKRINLAALIEALISKQPNNRQIYLKECNNRWIKVDFISKSINVFELKKHSASSSPKNLRRIHFLLMQHNA